MSLFTILSKIEQDDSIHFGRILVLLNVFVGNDNSACIEGLTKLAKLDFLLRYPTFLERALISKHGNIDHLLIKEYERKSIESSMVRYKYGPWDFRYRRLINILVAKGLVWIKVEGRTINIGLTDMGITFADKLSSTEAYADIAVRAKIIKQHFNFTATNLMKFVYNTFPEISTMHYGQEIDNEY